MSEMHPDRFLVAGASGMLGSALARVLFERGLECVAPPEGDFDITDPDAVARAVASFATESDGWLLNAAAYTNVERAEDEPKLAARANDHGARVLAAAARDAGLGFVHVSTDFVFDGTKRAPYLEDDEPRPLSVYGATKLAGELAVREAYPASLIVRTAWVYGPPTGGFPGKIMSAARQRESLSVVTDEVGSPTYTVDLARGLIGLAQAGATGLFHLAGSGACSRYELAAEAVRLAGLEVELLETTSDAFPTKAARPAYSVMDCGKAAALGVVLPDWRDALERYVAAEVSQ